MYKCVNSVVLIVMLLLLSGTKCDNTLKLGTKTVEENTCGTDVHNFEPLPGTGFDNLRNTDMGQVVLHSYKTCRLTDDRKYVVPDDVIVISTKQSDVEVSSELFENWLDYTSTSSYSINAHASFPYYLISGSFSDEKESVKKHQVNEKSSTTRVQVRHKLYTARIDNPTLHPTFKSRVLDIGAYDQNNDTRMARYLTQLLVRDYGTHVVTSVDLGGIFLQRDQIKSSFVNDPSLEKYQVKAAASALFRRTLAGGGFDITIREEVLKYYLTNRTSSKYQTFGGNPYKVNQTIKEWQNGLPNNMVTIDRDGDPLHYIVTTNTLPDFPEQMVNRISQLIEEEVKRYHEVNTYPGCTKMKSPNFNFTANLDDGSCVAPYNNYSFGGVYQTCEAQMGPNDEDFCSNLLQKNPLTGEFSCSAGYDEVQLNTGYHVYTASRQECKDNCIFLFLGCKNSCENVSYSIEAFYKTFWCAATGTVPLESGYLFGGVYTFSKLNTLTDTQGCPNAFIPLRMGAESFVCVSDDYELGYRYSFPFAGFLSCSAGNPLSLPSSRRKTPVYSVFGFFEETGSQSWPQECPTGYKKHFAVIDNDCVIDVCIKANVLSRLELPKVHRPPYAQNPGRNPNISETLYIVGTSSKVWVKNKTSQKWELVIESQDETFLPTDAKKNELEKNSSSSEVAGMTIGPHPSILFTNMTRLAWQVMTDQDNGTPQLNKAGPYGQLKGNSKRSVLLITVGITIGILVVIAFGILIVKYRRKLRRNEYSPIPTGTQGRIIQ